MGYQWNWSIFLQNASRHETYLDWLVTGTLLTLGIGLSAWCLAIFLGAFLGAVRTLPYRRFSFIAATYVEVFRNVPLLVQLFIWYFVAPELIPGGEVFKSINPFVQQFIVAVVCLTFFTAARVCEQVRAGIQSLPKGQLQAALALGLSLPQAYRLVLMPVAARVIIPPLTSEFLAVFKNSAVMSTIGLLELAAQGRQLVDYTAQPYECFLAISIIYLLINGVVMLGMRLLEERTKVPGLFMGR